MKVHELVRVAAVLCCSSVLLASCGGGGGGGGAADTAAAASTNGGASGTSGDTSTGGSGSAAPPPPALAAMVDSYGATMPSSFDGGNPAAAGVDGTAADGAPIANAPVQVFDKTGKSVTATTDANGVYHARIDGFLAPMIAVVTKADGSKWYSPSVAAPVKRGFIHVNLTGLTDKLASDVAVSLGKPASSQLTMTDLATNASSLASAKAKLNAALSSLLAASNLDGNTFDPVTAVFAANHTGYDNMLESLKIVNASGPTVMKPAHAVAGVIDGLGSATGLQLALGSEVVSIPANGKTFSFTHKVGEGDEYMVSVRAQPAGLDCRAYFGIPTMGTSDVTDVPVQCNTLFAGDPMQADQSQPVDGPASAARFSLIAKLVYGPGGSFYVNDNGALRRISPVGVVSTVLRGLDLARSRPVAVDRSGNVYYLPSSETGVGKLGADGASGFFPTPPQAAPMATDDAGNVYLANISAVYRMSPLGNVALLAGCAGNCAAPTGYVDGPGAAARFDRPVSLAVDAAGDVFVADYNNNTVRRITAAGFVSTVAGPQAGLKWPYDVAVFGNDVYVLNSGKGQVLKIAGIASTGASKGASSGPITVAAPHVPSMGMAIDAAGKLYLAGFWDIVTIP